MKNILLLSAFIFMGCASSNKNEEVVVAPKENPIILVEHTFNAPMKKTWQIFSETRYIKQWWGPHGFKATVKKNEFKTGGKIHMSMEGMGYPRNWNVATYQEIIPSQKIAMKMSFADDKGNIIPASQLKMPGKWEDTIDVTLDFKEVDGKTQVTLTEVGVPAEMTGPARMGWVQQFEKIDKILKK